MLDRRFKPTLLNRTLAHYRVLTQIEKGGMGEVYLAEEGLGESRIAGPAFQRARRGRTVSVLSPM